MYRLSSLPKSSGCQRCRHGSMWLVQEGLQIALSSFLGKYSFIPHLCKHQNWTVHKDHLLSTFSCVAQIEKWDTQREDGTFPGKIWGLYKSHQSTASREPKCICLWYRLTPAEQGLINVCSKTLLSGWRMRLIVNVIPYLKWKYCRFCIKISQALKCDSVVVCFMEQ